MNLKPDFSQLTLIGIQAALEAGSILKRGFGSDYAIFSKEGVQNLVTEFDTLSEKCIISKISKEFPEHGFLAEESGASANQDAAVLWVIDPLDGTVNFAHNVPFFSISIAAVVADQVVSAVVYQPILQELFTAEKTKGCYLNGKQIQVSQTRSLNQGLAATGFPYNIDQNPFDCIGQFAQIARSGAPIRRLGSAALDLAYIAAGRFDVYWEVSLKPWDMAAGGLLVEEAGGKVTNYLGAHRRLFSTEPILATNSLLHQEMINKLTPS